MSDEQAKDKSEGSIGQSASTGGLGHDHTCNCGMAKHAPHRAGEGGCMRSMTTPPRKVSCEDDRWMVDGHNITGYSMREQRGYHQHPCGCWSRSPESENSIDA